VVRRRRREGAVVTASTCGAQAKGPLISKIDYLLLIRRRPPPDN
jgi:hypothetical protein